MIIFVLTVLWKFWDDKYMILKDFYNINDTGHFNKGAKIKSHIHLFRITHKSNLARNFRCIH